MAADLVSNCIASIESYVNLYGESTCADAFVVMRFEEPIGPHFLRLTQPGAFGSVMPI